MRPGTTMHWKDYPQRGTVDDDEPHPTIQSQPWDDNGNRGGHSGRGNWSRKGGRHTPEKIKATKSDRNQFNSSSHSQRPQHKANRALCTKQRLRGAEVRLKRLLVQYLKTPPNQKRLSSKGRADQKITSITTNHTRKPTPDTPRS